MTHQRNKAMELEDSYKLQVLKEIVQKNLDRIEEIEDIERELALSRWLHDSFEEMSFEKPEFRDIFHREMHSLRKTLHQLDAKYTENKFELEKRRVLRQNFAIETFLIKTFAIDVDTLTGRKKPAAEAVPQPSIPPLKQKQEQELQQEPVKEMITPPDKEVPLFPSFTGDRAAKQKPAISKIPIPVVDVPVQLCEKQEKADKRISAEELICPQEQKDSIETEVPEEKSFGTPEQLEEQQMIIQEHIELITSIDMPPDPAPDHQQESCEEKKEEKVLDRDTAHRHRKVEKLNLNLPYRSKKISFMES